MTNQWPTLDYKKHKDTYFTLHLLSQILGKVQLKYKTWTNHSWHVTLRITPEGISTQPFVVDGRSVHLILNLKKHSCDIYCSDRKKISFDISKLKVKEFYALLVKSLEEIGLNPKINTKPSEMEGVERFENNLHHAYDKKAVENLHKALILVDHVFEKFRSNFLGKTSPSHFFWGGFDLAVTRFSGNTAPKHSGGVPNMPDWVAVDAYSHEVSSSGFFPGFEQLPYAAFYNYIYPEPQGFKESSIKPETAFYSQDMQEFILPYDDVVKAENPQKVLMEFLKSTYDCASELANWDKSKLEYKLPKEK